MTLGDFATLITASHERDAGGDQLGAGRVDPDRGVRALEADLVVGAGDLAVLQLGLGDRGAEVDVPQGGRLGPVGQVTMEQAQEAALAGLDRLGADGAVPVVPVDRQPQLAYALTGAVEGAQAGLDVDHGDLPVEGGDRGTCDGGGGELPGGLRGPLRP